MILQTSYGSEHRDVANRLGGLANTYLALGRFDEAVPLLKRAITITRATYGDEHLDVATWKGNLAEAYRELGRAAEAVP